MKVLAISLIALTMLASARPAEKVTPAFAQPITNIPGKSLIAAVVDYAPGGASPSHRHAPSAFIFAYVISGRIRSSVDGAPARIYGPGDSWSEKPGAHHTLSENASDTAPARLLAVFVVDDKEKQLVLPDDAR